MNQDAIAKDLKNKQKVCFNCTALLVEKFACLGFSQDFAACLLQDAQAEVGEMLSKSQDLLNTGLVREGICTRQIEQVTYVCQ